MPYVQNNNLTIGYIHSLIVRCGFTDVTSAHVGEAVVAWIDQNGFLNTAGSLASARDVLIYQWRLQQDSP